MDKIQKRNAEEYLKDKEFFSTGGCPGCEDCGLNDDPTEEQIDIASTPYFSWSRCVCCNSPLGGDRHPAHYVDENGDINHINICTDCLFYVNGYEEDY